MPLEWISEKSILNSTLNRFGPLMRCNICNTFMGEPIYESRSDQALTSLCELRQGSVRVWSCPGCAHLRGEALLDTGAYYESEYRISMAQDDEDQIYEVHGDRVVYRTDHQVATLLGKLDLPPAARLLDYGCAKASTPKRLLASRGDLKVCLFDVSEMYMAYWLRFVDPDRCAVHHAPPAWDGYFDVVTSFFALEHIPEPQRALQDIAKLLRDDGVFYGVVPDTFGNVADFVVIDHVNHFTVSSLYTLLRTANFGDIEIDAEAHRGALVFSARRRGGVIEASVDIGATLGRALQLAGYWENLGEHIQKMERSHVGLTAAIYGSGFYGAYIMSTLKCPEKVVCFLDASPYQQGNELFDRPILAPDQLPDVVRVLYVGLNPSIARKVIAQLDRLKATGINLVYLDDISDD